jgi:hypothetical protein
MSGKLNQNQSQINDAVDELRQRGLMNFEFLIKFQIFCSLVLATGISALKLVITRGARLFAFDNDKSALYTKRINGNSNVLSAAAVLAKSVFR